MPPERYHWKGRYVSKKVYEHMLRRSESGMRNKDSYVAPTEKIYKEEADVTPKYPIEGARIIDLKHMAEQMYCSNCKEKLHLDDIKDERIRGLGSFFKVQCNNCATLQSVESGPLHQIPGSSKKTFEINSKLPIGAIRSGIGHKQADTFLSTFEVPVLSKNVYKNQERLVGPFIEDVAKKSCVHAVELERSLTLENLEKLKDLLPPETDDNFLVYYKNINGQEVQMVRLYASFDFGWSQRSNGYNYDSLNGYGCLIGMLSGMILDYVSFNRKCQQCDYNEKTNTVKEHDCRLNFHGSAKAMESEGAHKLVVGNKILKDANVEIGVFIADNDSSSISAIQNASSYFVIKQSDMNHTKKGVGNALYNITSKMSKDPDRELQHDTIKTLKKYFSYAVKQNIGDLEKMRAAIKNIPNHVFNHHEGCGPWCKATENKENYVGLQLENPVLFGELKNLFDKLAENATKFLMAASSQANESLNNSMCSKAPKRICYSKSESCDYRFACTVVEKNYGEAYLSCIFKALNCQSTTRLMQRIQRVNQTASKRKLRESTIDVKRRRIELTQIRSQLRYRKEKSEGLSYSSNMSLFDTQELTSVQNPNVDGNHSEPISNHQESNDSNNSIAFETNEIAIVFFDLETGGFDMFKDEVLQVSLKCGETSFNSYITPTRPINPRSSEVHNLTRINKNLFKNGEKVVTCTKALVVLNVLNFLKSLGKKCILVAHKCEFDSRRLIILAKSCNLLRDYQEIILGFTDTLPLFKKKIVDVENFKLTTLASCKLQISCLEAHDAQFDVEILEKLSKKFLNIEDLMAINVTFADICMYVENKERSRNNKDTFLPLKDVISKGMMQRLSEANFNYKDLIDAYRNGKDCATQLLQGKVNGTAKIIRNKKILNAILNHLEIITKD